MKNLIRKFNKYFKDKLDEYDYEKTLSALKILINEYDIDVEANSKLNEKNIKQFVKKFYRTKRNLWKRYKRIENYSNSKEWESLTLTQKIISRNTMLDILKIYVKLKSFEKLVNETFNILMFDLDREIQQEMQMTPII